MTDAELIGRYFTLDKTATPVLKIYFNGDPYVVLEKENCRPPFFIQGMPFSDILKGIYFADKACFTSPQRIEKLILSLVTSTNFKNIKDIEVIRRGRYIVKPLEFGHELCKKLFDFILNSKSKRISRSWLIFLQSQIVEGKIKKKNDFDNLKANRTPRKKSIGSWVNQISLKKKPWGGEEMLIGHVNDIIYDDVSEPIMEDKIKERQFPHKISNENTSENPISANIGIQYMNYAGINFRTSYGALIENMLEARSSQSIINKLPNEEFKEPEF